ncbi:MAG TPA: protein kinase [Polyangiales bacterium]|nr:protein kinase [Polyangiales bacterium]
MRFAERFELHEVLGRGGMAVVYRATDLGSGRTVALKQLLGEERDEQRGHVEMLFEREFHTLSQLSHPCVIEVYDYGVTPEGVCYYTMELLDGGPLRARVPLPWREACRLIFDVCSSLALLHSRRLLHRDVSPRNVHCTHDGNAKLIDFGAVVPMASGGGLIVGTPPFTAPEVLHRSATDGRTDLYALGATLYYALTGHLAYPARTFAELFASWNQRPAPPSVRVPEIPKALDDLTMSLLSLEPALRPPSAFAVMQRLAAIANLESKEAAGVSRAYLETPALAGRQALLTHLREVLLRGLTTGGRGMLLWSTPGLGRSRMLDAVALEAKTLGARVLRANARGKSQDFEVALALAQHLLDAVPSEQLPQQVPWLFEPQPNDRGALPRLREPAQLRSEPERLEQSLVQLMRAATKIQPIVIAVDDVHRIDERSAAVIATLIDRLRFGRAFVLLTAESQTGALAQALDALSRRCDQITLEALSQEDTRTLLASVFGDVPNLTRTTEEIYALARGNPRVSMDLAQHLIDRGLITYDGGVWTLPSAVSPRDLPRSAEAAIRARIEALGPLARYLGQAHALSFVERLAHEDYRVLAGDADPGAVNAALSELLQAQALTGDGQSYVLANRLWSSALEESLDAVTRERAHRGLAALFKPRIENAWMHHVLADENSPETSAAVEALLASFARVRDMDDQTLLMEEDLGRMVAAYSRALEAAPRLKRPPRDMHDLRRGLMAISIPAGEPDYYWAVAPGWLQQLIHDTGLDIWHADTEHSDPGERLTHALTKAFERYQALPEHERAYRPDEAIPMLGEYVAISIAIAARTMDYALFKSLPGLLEPFAPLSILLSALWQNAVGCLECHDHCHYEDARARWLDIHAKLRDVSAAELRYASAIRNAIAFGIGILEAEFGLPSAARWADELEKDPYHRVSAMYLRKIVRLEQGDFAGADKLQRSAEVAALRARIPSMFTASLTVEISAHSLARDLAGIKDVIERERAEAARYPGWIPYVREAEARFELIRGDFAQAKACYDQLMVSVAPNDELYSSSWPVWVAAQSGICEALLGLERPAEARDTALAALRICEKLQIRTFSHDIVRMLALAEAKLGDFPAAIARIEGLIATQNAAGVEGLRLGISYEVRARIALWNDDARAFDTYARLTAREYRHGAGSPLGARYERLTDEARRRGIQPGVGLSDFELTTSVDSEMRSLDELRSVVHGVLGKTQVQADRHQRALRLVCSSRAARGGHLYLPGADGPQLAATCDLSAPDARLGEQVREYLEEQEDRFETQTVAIELHSMQTSVPVAHADGIEYELLLLTCVNASEARVAGVIAVAPGEQRKKNPRESQLLASIAEQL